MNKLGVVLLFFSGAMLVSVIWFMVWLRHPCAEDIIIRKADIQIRTSIYPYTSVISYTTESIEMPGAQSIIRIYLPKEKMKKFIEYYEEWNR